MANAYLIDSNILLRISRRDDPDYRIVDSALERLLRDDAALFYTSIFSVRAVPAHGAGPV